MCSAATYAPRSLRTYLIYAHMSSLGQRLLLPHIKPSATKKSSRKCHQISGNSIHFPAAYILHVFSLLPHRVYIHRHRLRRIFVFCNPHPRSLCCSVCCCTVHSFVAQYDPRRVVLRSPHGLLRQDQPGSQGQCDRSAQRNPFEVWDRGFETAPAVSVLATQHCCANS